MGNIDFDTDFVSFNELMPFPLMILDIKGKILHTNNPMKEVLAPDHDLVGMSLFDFIQPEDIDTLQKSFSKTIHTGSDTSFEVRNVSNEKASWFKGKAKSINKDAHCQIILNLENITEQKFTQSLLETKKSILEMIVKRVPLQKILGEISIRIEELFLMKAYCTLVLLGEDHETIESVVSPNIPEKYFDELLSRNINSFLGSCGTAMHRKETVISSNISEDPLWNDYRESVLPLGLQACWSVPVIIDQDVVGAFALYHPIPTTPTNNELEIIQCLANLVGLAVERNRAEQCLLKENEQKYRSLFEHNPNGLFSVDLEGNLINFNQSLLEIFGYLPEEMYRSYKHFVVPEYLDRTIEHFNNAVEGITQHYEMVGIHKQGHHIFLKITNFPILIQGEVVGVYGIAEDISELKRVIEEQKQTKELLESVFMNSGDSIAVFSLDGKLQGLNPAAEAIFGWGEEILGYHFPGIPDKEEINKIKQTVKNGEILRLESIRKKNDGTTFDVSVTYSPLRDCKGRITGIISSSRDISEKKRTEELLKRAEKLAVVGQLSAAVAHEIRNPLTSVKGFIQLYSGQIRQEIKELMLSEIEQIEQVVTEFLSLAKPQATHFKRINISTLMHQTMSILEKQAIYNQIELITDFGLDLPSIYCDENKIKQVLVNIIKNAIESMGNKGELFVSTRKEEDYLLIKIQDEGCGIPKEKLERLGEPFYSNKEKGTGLGLMVCFNIIEEHNGKLEFSSEEGKGTTVKILLPI